MASTKSSRPLSLATLAIHGARTPHEPGDPVVEPLVQSVNHVQAIGTTEGLTYTRYGNTPNAWCRRIRRAGWRCVFTPHARILHLDGGSKSTAQIRSRMYVQLQKSKIIYLRKHHGISGALVGRIIFLMSALSRLLLAFGQDGDEAAARRRLALASLRYHLFQKEPTA